ncbi:MAG: hypothetical protein JO212_15950 [Acetobacteraceae bacterium]|nr:hypothetical protein [Acetobacteraceae bacterium]
MITYCQRSVRRAASISNLSCPPRRRDLAQALIIARGLDPAAKLATARMLDPATASHSLGEVLGLARDSANELYAALDWLGSEQDFIERRLGDAAAPGWLRCCSMT